jgi:hypothetical protein
MRHVPSTGQRRTRPPVTAERVPSPFGQETDVNAGIYGNLRVFPQAPVSFVQSRRVGTRESRVRQLEQAAFSRKPARTAALARQLLQLTTALTICRNDSSRSTSGGRSPVHGDLGSQRIRFRATGTSVSSGKAKPISHKERSSSVQLARLPLDTESTWEYDIILQDACSFPAGTASLPD